jgi:DICT domain-containing protein
MENFMKIDENFVVDFLNKVMRGAISSKEKQILKKNPELAKQVKKMRKMQSDISKNLSKMKGSDL